MYIPFKFSWNIYTKIEHILDHKTNLNKIKRWNHRVVFFDVIKLEINTWMITGKFLKTWKWNKTFPIIHVTKRMSQVKFLKLHWTESESFSVMSNSLRPHKLYSPWNSPGQNTGVGSLFLLQGIFPTQGLNPCLPHCRWILYQLSHKGSPRILEWVAYPFSRGSSWPRNQPGVSCIAGGFFTNWAIREAQLKEN